jgi:hypothetical protein
MVSKVWRRSWNLTFGMLYTYYSQYNRLDTPQIKSDFEALYPAIRGREHIFIVGLFFLLFQNFYRLL